MISRRWIYAATLAVMAATPVIGTAQAQIGDLLKAPKTLIDRAIEARSAEDIAIDNRIVIAVNGIMADLGTIKASTEIYEQNLLVTGIFTDPALYDDFKRRVETVDGVKNIYWHTAYMTESERASRENELLRWDNVLVLDTKAEAALIGTRGVADVNFRIAVDSFATAYVLGRARSQEEQDKAIETLRGVEGVKQVVNYSVVRP